MKNYTDLEQSKKLAEILPIKSADMHYNDWNDDFCVGYKHTGEYIADLGAPTIIRGELEIPCWSLAALLRLIPNFNMFKRTIECRIETTDHFIDKASDLIDVAFEMICWLKENNKI